MKAERECPDSILYFGGDSILYFWKDRGDDKIIKALLEKKLDMLILANGFNFGHIHHALAHAQVA